MVNDASESTTGPRGQTGGRIAARSRLGVLLGLAALATVALVAVPALLLRPFNPQTPATVTVAYALRTVSPWLAPAGAGLTALVAAFLLHRRPRRASAVVVVLAVATAGAAAWFSRQNHFEWMFAPLPSAAYARARDVSFVGDPDMVVAVEVNGDAVAYPVRQMAYHHLLNDEVGGIPVVSTY
jgi:hypothetical protein